MKRIQIQNEFTQWAEYLARYFGHDLIIYDKEGSRMWGEPAVCHREVDELKKDWYVTTVYKDIGQPIAYLDWRSLTPNEEEQLCVIKEFIESQLDDEGA